MDGSGTAAGPTPRDEYATRDIKIYLGTENRFKEVTVIINDRRKCHTAYGSGHVVVSVFERELPARFRILDEDGNLILDQDINL